MNDVQDNLWNTGVLDDNVRQVCDTCFGQRQIRKLCGQGALRKHTSESVLMVSELLCTGVQGHTQEHKQGNAREMCSCLKTVNTPPHVNLEWRDSENPTELAQVSWTTTLALDQSGQINFFTVQGSFASCNEEH